MTSKSKIWSKHTCNRASLGQHFPQPTCLCLTVLLATNHELPKKTAFFARNPQTDISHKADGPHDVAEAHAIRLESKSSSEFMGKQQRNTV